MIHAFAGRLAKKSVHQTVNAFLLHRQVMR